MTPGELASLACGEPSVMNSLRPELLELTPQALTALSNAGFVKLNLKELENGNVPEISHENGALIATFSDGVPYQLANGQALKGLSAPAGQRHVPSSRDAGVKLSTTLCHRPAYGKKRRRGGIRQSG